MGYICLAKEKLFGVRKMLNNILIFCIIINILTFIIGVSILDYDMIALSIISATLCTSGLKDIW